ncbi:ATP synthase subunit gamma, mitochondrial-like [Anguilla anguilla]|uniref:ATP synthase subunit gamma, mitochondrial-like n=1 Tax=Anguilla anguilla TaxID=7936 RepID=UPI0015AFC202|nr:ATP synthase subunit gamma, mitochondrial-like [Anguilla anguilla]
MFARTYSAVFLPKCGQVRDMATMKEITLRLKSVKSIQKITKSMKMVAAAKYARAEKALKPARVYGTSALELYEKVEIKAPEDRNKHVVIGVSSDRGLCGAVHANVAKAVKREVGRLTGVGKEVMLVNVGDKLRGLLYKTHGKHVLLNCKDVGRKTATFSDAAAIATELLDSGYQFDQGTIFFNRFKSVISYTTVEKPVFSMDTVASSEAIGVYDDIDADVLRNYQEFALVNTIFLALKESAASEHSARMTSMDSASNNATEMIEKLTLKLNRTRQAAITKELIEIISGAAVL